MSKSLKLLCIIAGTFIVVLVLYSFYDRQFKLSNIQGDWPRAENPKTSEKELLVLREAVSQPYHYLDRGKQAYVFVSQDQRYVLKFFDNRCLRSGTLPFFFSISEKRCQKKLSRLFRGYQTARFDPEHSGLLFLQLAPDPLNQLHVSVTGRFGIKHEINLAEVPFALQEKAVPLRELINALLREGKVKEAKSRLHQIMDMYLEGYQKGIVDMDHNFMYNTGFVGEHPIRIDLGRLKQNDSIKDPTVYTQDLEKVFHKRLGEWLDRHFPKYRDEILQDIKS
jgi:hypothetical protein